MKTSYKEFDAIVGLQVVHLMPGQFVFGRKKAAKETGLTEREIRTLLALLIKWQNVTIETTNRFSVITIINWPIYQSDEIENDQLNDQQTTSRRPHTNIKELKNNIYSENALQVLAYLNEKTGRLFKTTGHIVARLNDGHTIEDCKRVIDGKLVDPYFIENPKYLNPTTLFRPSNFDRYLNAAIPLKLEAKKTDKNSSCPKCGAQCPPQDRTQSGCIHCEEVA